MRTWWIARALAIVTLVFAVACDKGGTSEEAAGGEEDAGTASAGGEEPSFDDAGDRMAYERCAEELPNLRARLESGELSSIGCAGISAYANRISDHSDERVTSVASAVLELCGLDVPLAEAEAKLSEAQAKRQDDPAAIIAAECSMANSALGRVDAAYGEDTRVAELRGRIDAFCAN